MPAKGDRNWPDHEVNEFLDQITAGRAGLPAPGRAAAGDRLHLGDGRARQVALRQPPGRGDPRLHRRGVQGRPRPLGPPPAPRRPRAGAGERNRDYLGDRNTRPVEYRMCTRERRRSSGCSTRRCWRPTTQGVPVWHGVLYDISERKTAEAELQRALAQQAVVAKLGERALQDGDPESLMRAADRADRRSRRRPQRLHLGARPRRPPPQPARRPRGRGGRRRPPRLRRPRLPRRRRARLRHPDDRPRLVERGALHDAAGPARLRRRQQPGGDDRRQGPPLRRARRPRHRAAPLHPQGRPLRAGRRQRARRRDRAPRRRPGAAPPRPPRLAHRPAQPAQLRRRPRRRRCGGRPPPARRSGSSSSTSTTSS